MMARELPAMDYQPTKAELEEPLRLNRDGLSADEAARNIAQRLTAPTNVAEVSAADWRKRRKVARRRRQAHGE